MLICKWLKRSGVLFLVFCMFVITFLSASACAEENASDIKGITIYPSESLASKLSKLKGIFQEKKCWNVDGEKVSITFGDVTLVTKVNSKATCDHSDKDFTVTRCQGFGFKKGKPACGGKSDSFNKSYQCAGYARMLGWAVSGMDPWGKLGEALKDNKKEKREKAVNALVPGDIIQIGNNENRHSAFVTAVSDDQITVTELNTGDNRCRIYWGKTYTKKDLKGNGTARNKLYRVAKYSDYNTGVYPKKIDIKGSSEVNVKETITLKATVTPAKAKQDVIWKSSDEKIAKIDSKGIVTGIKKGTVRITATSKIDQNIFASKEINVCAWVDPESVEISGPNGEKGKMTLTYGDSVTLTAKVLPVDAKQDVTWESNNPTVASVDQNGKVKVRSAAGVAKITAKCKANPKVHGVFGIVAEPEGKPQEEFVPIDEKHFPDADFRKYIKQFDKDKDGKFSKEELLSVKEICISGEESDHIETIKGVEYFTELKTLSISHAFMLKEADVSKNVNLTSLHFDRSCFKKLDVSKNNKLKELDCRGCGLTELILGKQDYLTYLRAEGNPLKKLDISKCKKILKLIKETEPKEGTEYGILTKYWGDIMEDYCFNIAVDTKLILK